MSKRCTPFPCGLVEGDELRIGPILHVVDAEAALRIFAEIALAGLALKIDHHDVADHPRLVGVRPRMGPHDLRQRSSACADRRCRGSSSNEARSDGRRKRSCPGSRSARHRAVPSGSKWRMFADPRGAAPASASKAGSTSPAAIFMARLPTFVFPRRLPPAGIGSNGQGTFTPAALCCVHRGIMQDTGKPRHRAQT